jgi:hypothetical protein
MQYGILSRVLLRTSAVHVEMREALYILCTKMHAIMQALYCVLITIIRPFPEYAVTASRNHKL